MRAAIASWETELFPRREVDENMTGAISLSVLKQCSASRAKVMRTALHRWVGACAVALICLGGCARERDAALPVACQAGTSALREALRSAPDPVRIEGVAPSQCLDEGSDGGEVQQVGAIYIEAAAQLAEPAAANPGGPEAVQLGYLVGAARRGAASSQGVHYELVRRLEQELRSVRPPSTAVRDAIRAGRESG